MNRAFLVRRIPLRRLLRAFWTACIKVVDDGGVVIASNVALSLLLSLFPFLMLIASIVRYYGSPETAQAVVDLVLGHWPADAAQPIAFQINILMSQPPSEFLSFSTVVALVLASNGIENLRDGLNRAYKVPETRSFFYRRFEACLMVVGGAVGLIAVAFVLVGTPFLWSFLERRLSWLDEFVFSFTAAQYVFAIALLWAILLAFHKLLPDLKGQRKQMRWGIALTIAGIIVGSKLFAFYLSTFANYTALYAGLAGMMVAIVYLYCLSVLLLWGAEFNTALNELRASERLRQASEAFAAQDEEAERVEASA